MITDSKKFSNELQIYKVFFSFDRNFLFKWVYDFFGSPESIILIEK